MAKTVEYLPPVSFRFNVLLLDDLASSKSKATDYLFSDKKGSGNQTFKETSFVSVSGLETELQTEDVRVGGVNNITYNLPTKVRYSPLVLSRGIVTKGSKYIEWYWKYVNSTDGKVEKKNLLISLLNSGLQPIIIWLVVDAFPTNWKISGLEAKNNEVLLEEIKLAYSRFEIISVD